MTQSATKIRLEVLDRLAKERGWKRDVDIARELQVSHPTISNLRADRCGVGSLVIDRCIKAFGPECYSELFYREEES